MTGARALRLGTFDVERRWRPDRLAVLPEIVDRGADVVTSAMDELLAVACEPGDVLVTGAPPAAGWGEVLAGAGVGFEHRVAPAGVGGSVEERLLARPLADLGGLGFEPYAVLPESAGVVGALGLQAALPDWRVVRAVSSKSWSNALVRDLGLAGAGVVVDSVAGVEAEVAALRGAPALLKDPFGVSGRGVLAVTSPLVLRSVVRVLGKQVRRGLDVEVLVQRRFDPVADFSAQFVVRPGGEVDWLGVRLTENTGFAYAGSRPAPPGLAERLAASGYRDVMADVGAALADAGYLGPVCVDSMLLRDGTAVPVLEINPRMSMGLISVLAGRRLAADPDRVRLVVRPSRGGCGFDRLVGLLRAEGILLRAGGIGVLPLSSGALASSRGRLYCAVVARDEAGHRALDAALDAVLAAWRVSRAS
ncbi:MULTISPECIES: hypothetical protein [Actinosynnema]|uniref:hypothetical protein n=1 Tax=Actinosynnema TaxID=40566 RepID=UPI0020A3B9AD|nr:hypothetical protein [Actinosynnema pretiosum]MCP2094346.1 hypothetical protein [Actinosynnema pretiosum]